MNTPIILAIKYSSEKRVIAALREGINDYFKWPCIVKDLVDAIRRNLLEFCHQPNRSLKKSSECRGYRQAQIDLSKPMRRIKAYLLKVVSTDSTVFIRYPCDLPMQKLPLSEKQLITIWKRMCIVVAWRLLSHRFTSKTDAHRLVKRARFSKNIE